MRAVVLVMLVVLAGPADAQTPATVAPTDAPPCVPPQEAGQQSLKKQLESGPLLQAWWRAEPSPLRVGQPFALLVTLCPAQARLLRVDAHMPEHRHGMNYRASIKPLGEGRWRVEGLLWHMSGRWELSLDLQSQGKEHRLRQSVILP